MKTIRQKLLLFMLITGFIPLIVVMIPLLTVLSRNLRELEEEKLADVARQLGRHVTEVMDRSARDLETLVTNPLLADPKGQVDEKLKEMRRLVDVYEAYSDLSLYDADGFLIASTAENHPAYREYSTWFNEALQGRTTVSQPQRRLGSDGLYLTVFLPVKAANGAISQVIKARLSFAKVMALVTATRVGDGGEAILLDAWGNTICSRDGRRLLEKFDPGVTPTHWLIQSIGNYARPDGEAFLYASEALPKSQTYVDSHWVVVAMKPLREVDAVMRQAQATLAVAAVATVIGAILLGLFFAGRISLPLEKIGHVARLVAGGDLGVRADVGGPEEIDQLATSFNKMISELSEHRSGLERLVLSRTESLRRSQAELERTSARLQAAFDSTNNGFLVEDADGRVALVNGLFLSLMELSRDTLYQGGHRDVVAAFRKGWEFGGADPGSLEARLEADETVDCEIFSRGEADKTIHLFSTSIRDQRGKRIGRVWTIQDLTEQRRLESSLRQSQKMEAIGQLAGGVAHDFNNLLTGILGNLALVDLELEKSDPTGSRDHLHHAIRAGERAADLVKQLLGFSRRSRMDLKVCDANEVIAEVRDLLAATIDPRIRIELVLEERPWRVMADLSLISQVIMNMAVNAKDAMPSGGHLWLRSSNRTILPDETRGGTERKPGDYMMLTIEDDGEGIPYDVQKRVFEPFFTTKPQGKGTGLGLATSFGIVKQLGGWIEMDSRPGQGTRFDIYLPRSAAAEAQPELPVAPILTSTGSALAGASTGCETVLVVDDEDLVRRVARSLLKKLGYVVIEARDGVEALELFGSRGGEIDLVLLDLTMPNLSGKETFRLIRERHGRVPVLICSGYLVDVTDFAEECGSCPEGFIQKPYRFEDMSSAIRAALTVKRCAA